MDALRGDTFSSADEDDSGATAMLCTVAALLVVGIVSGVSSLVTAAVVAQPTEAAAQEEVATVYDMASETVVTEVRTDGPIYDLPSEVSQTIVCDRLNREYLLLTTGDGGVCFVPYLDEDGNQAVAPRS